MVGLTAMAAGSVALSVLPAMFGVAGYVAAIAILTPGYQLFQAANNTAVMMDVQPDQRGVMSGMLSLSRNLGLITGASLMGAVFALASMTERHHDGASRGRCRGHADHVRARGGADRRRARSSRLESTAARSCKRFPRTTLLCRNMHRRGRLKT